MTQHPVMFAIVILILAFTILVRNTKLVSIQAGLLLVFLLIGASASNTLLALFLVLQLCFGALVLFKFREAVDDNCRTILEKTRYVRRMF